MPALPVFAAGATITVEERWQGLSWSAEPHRVVASDPARLVTWMPAGSLAVRAGNRDLPGLATMDRAERKLLALQTLRVRAVQTAEWPTKLYVFGADRWSHVTLGWHPETGDFTGWYVNFEQAPAAGEHGLWTKDLVLDLFVQPDGSWAWKDADDFEAAISRGIVGAELREILARETDVVLAELADRTGAFDPQWVDFVAPSDWPAPELPADFALDAPRWAALSAV